MIISTFPGLLISGGGDYMEPEASVEVFFPSTGQSCSLPSLPDDRYEHTMDNLLICGGNNSDTSCLTFTSGEWVMSHTLVHRRVAHASWQTEDGRVVLMGGSYSIDTTETINLAGEQGEPSFDTQYTLV